MIKAKSSTSMKQHYTMPSVVIAAGVAGSTKPNLSPRRRAPDDIRISAPRFVLQSLIHPHHRSLLHHRLLHQLS
jgi:hypothetical protein